jgi:hypothetical protein
VGANDHCADFPGGLLAQVRTLQRTKTHLFPNTGLAAVIEQFLAVGSSWSASRCAALIAEFLHP